MTKKKQITTKFYQFYIPRDPETLIQDYNFRSAIMTPRNTSVHATSNHQHQSSALAVSEAAKPEVVEDKYAALKDLDEIFKNTVVVTDGKTTGTSIFGSSPLAQTQPSAQISPTTNVFGPSPTNGLGEFPTTWGTTTTDVRNDHRGPSPNAGWASNWPSSTTNNGAKAAPINPFTGKRKNECFY